MYLISQELINKFAEVSGDHNPIHVDVETASKTKFGGTISHGALLISLFSAELADRFPGVVVGSLGMEFRKPVRAGSIVSMVLGAMPCDDGTVDVLVDVMVGTARVAIGKAKLVFPKGQIRE